MIRTLNPPADLVESLCYKKFVNGIKIILINTDYNWFLLYVYIYEEFEISQVIVILGEN